MFETSGDSTTVGISALAAIFLSVFVIIPALQKATGVVVLGGLFPFAFFLLAVAILISMFKGS